MGRVIEMPLPRLGETMEEGRIGLIVKQPGDAFRRGETLLEVESDKTTVEVPALQDGILLEWLVATDQMVPVDSAIARIEIEGEAVAEAKVASSPEPSSRRKRGPVATGVMATGPRRGHGSQMRPRASTAARAAARRAGADLSGIPGTGRHGRITRADLAAALRPARATNRVETPAGNLFFREWPGQGKATQPVLLIHGLFAESQSFTTLGRKLAGLGHHVLAADLPGHGGTQSPASSPDDIAAAVAAALPPGRFHMVAHSFGAIIATKLLDRALSLTLLAPAGCGETINGDFIAAMLDADLGRALPLLGEGVPVEVQGSLAAQLSANSHHLRAIASHVCQEGRQMVSIIPALARAPVPVQAVFLRDDPVIPVNHALDMPFNVAVRIMPGASHLPHWRDPDAIAGLVAGQSG